MGWLGFAFISAGAAAATAILAKIGIAGVPSHLATAIRTIVITGFAWAIVAGTGEHRALGSISRRSLVFLVLSGVAAGIPRLARFPAPRPGPAAPAAPRAILSPPRRASARHGCPWE